MAFHETLPGRFILSVGRFLHTLHFMTEARDESRLTPEMLLWAYSIGMFPMAEDAEDPNLHWVEPQRRGIFPLERFHVPRRLARKVRLDAFEVRIDCDFDAVISHCAASVEKRETTWINGQIRDLYGALFQTGQVHTVETYREGRLVGGLYGVSLGGAFFGESMFHTETDASKVALVHLVGRLIAGGYRLLDAQFKTTHLQQFSIREVPQAEYKRMLAPALAQTANFHVWPKGESVPGAVALAAIGSVA